MKQILFLVLMMFSLTGCSQKTDNWTPPSPFSSSSIEVECYSCQSDKRVDCNGCGIKSKFFTGLVVSSGDFKDIPFYHPIKIHSKGNLITLEDAFGTKKDIQLSKLKGYSRVIDFYSYLEECFCADNSYDDTAILQTLAALQEQIALMNNVINSHIANDLDTDPTNELQDWSNLPGIPTDFSDGIDNVDDADNDPTNEIETWSTLAGIPADFADGIDNIDDADNDPLNEIELPPGGTNGQVLETDGAGNYSWVDASETTTTFNQTPDGAWNYFNEQGSTYTIDYELVETDTSIQLVSNGIILDEIDKTVYEHLNECYLLDGYSGTATEGGVDTVSNFFRSTPLVDDVVTVDSVTWKGVTYTVTQNDLYTNSGGTFTPNIPNIETFMTELEAILVAAGETLTYSYDTSNDGLLYELTGFSCITANDPNCILIIHKHGTTSSIITLYSKITERTTIANDGNDLFCYEEGVGYWNGIEALTLEEVLDNDGIPVNPPDTCGAETLIEIPSTYFDDKTNPTMIEVQDWVTANLDECQLKNSQLYMVEDYQTLVNQEVNKKFSLTPNGALVENLGILSWTANATVDDIVIDGTSYPINVTLTDASGGLLFPSSVKADSIKDALEAASLAEGLSINWTVNVFSNGDGADYQLEVQGQKFNTPITGDVTDFTMNTTNFITNTYNVQSEVVVETVATSLGTTKEEPDYIWNVIFGEIDETFRRTNQGGVLYVSGDISEQRSFYGQRGNPNRPFRDPWQARDASQAGDLIIILKGEYTWGAIGSGAYKESDGTDRTEISLVRDNLNYYAYPGVTFRALSIQRNPIFHDETGFTFSFKGHADFIIPSNNVGLAEFYGSQPTNATIEINNWINGGSQWAIGISIWNSSNLNFKANRVESYLARLLRWQGANGGRMNVVIDDYYSPESDADWQFQNLVNCNIDIHFKNSDIAIRFQNGFYGNIDSTNVNIKFDNSIWRTYNGSSVKYDVINAAFSNSILNIDYGNALFMADKVLCDVSSTSLINSKINISTVMTDKSTIQPFYSVGAPTGDGEVFFNLDITTDQTKTNGIVRVDNNSYTKIGGRLFSSIDNTLIKTNASIHLRNLELITGNSSGLPVVSRVSGTTALNIITSNVISNSTILDPNLTEIGEPILRNTSFR